MERLNGSSLIQEVTLKLKTTVYGDMIYLPHDQYVGKALDMYGEYGAGEVEFFRYIAQYMPGDAIDAGANMGAHTAVFSALFSHVYAFEPQAVIYRLLRANTALYSNVTTYRAALGNEEGFIHLPQLNYAVSNNYGGMGKYMEWDRKNQAHEVVQQRMIDKIDAIRAADKISLIKIDVEGMESEVIEGAMAIIDKHRPALYVENDKPKKSSQLLNLIYNLDYQAWWHITPLFNENNFYKQPENAYKDLCSFNLICVPKECNAEIANALPCTPEHPYLPEGCVTNYD
jgi:FkbM family methyltransferase